MAFIKVLSDELINKIQAGEVIERPASIVKELTENSIDAGSQWIKIEVSHAGKGLIRIADDGIGMDKEDALLSLQRHATSKLHSEDSLFDIKTLGFRGEALPSIASVSRLLLITAPKGTTKGISIEAEGGRIKNVKDAPSFGTTIEVRDIFFNVPPRKKFLKTDSTELMHIIEAVTRLSISHPEIGFSLKADSTDVMNLPKAEGIRERLMQIYGSEFLSGLIEINTGKDALGLNAFVSKKDNLRQRRSHQYIFINKRPVREQSITHAIYSAYEGMPGTHRHPIYFAFLSIDPKTVDFNVHPTKYEVRFRDKEAVYRLVKDSITMTDTFHENTAPKEGPRALSDVASAEAIYPFREAPPAPYIAEALTFGYRVDLPFIYIGDTFIALSEGGGLTLIDHHAAHERVLYERLLKATGIKSVEFLFPRQVKLSPKEYMIILKHKDMLNDLGIGLDDFGHDTVIVRALPEAVREADLTGMLQDVASALLDGSMPIKPLKEAVAARIACHSSVRGSVMLNQEGLSSLLHDLGNTEHPEVCPHGRPTRVFYSLDDLKRLFKRK